MKGMCKYYIVFTLKYRQKIVYNQCKTDLQDILKQLCSYLDGHLMPEHVHMLYAGKYISEKLSLLIPVILKREKCVDNV